jgi:hypothetical protein
MPEEKHVLLRRGGGCRETRVGKADGRDWRIIGMAATAFQGDPA